MKFQEIKKYLIRLYLGHYKAWGVAFETDLPPEFIITEHAKERMAQRCGWHREKMMKLTVKAWHSNEKVPQEYINIKEYKARFGGQTGEYRRLMGKTFIFTKKYNSVIGEVQKKLITVY